MEVSIKLNILSGKVIPGDFNNLINWHYINVSFRYGNRYLDLYVFSY